MMKCNHWNLTIGSHLFKTRTIETHGYKNNAQVCDYKPEK